MLQLTNLMGYSFTEVQSLQTRNETLKQTSDQVAARLDAVITNLKATLEE